VSHARNNPAEESSDSEDMPKIQSQEQDKKRRTDQTEPVEESEATNTTSTSVSEGANVTDGHAGNATAAGQKELAGDEAEALAGFSLSTADPLELDPDFQPVPVFKDSKLVGSWNTCLAEIKGGNVNRASCVVEPDYADRISFAFEIKDMDLPYAVTSPLVVGSRGSSDPGMSSEPEVVDFSLNRKTSSGSFTVVYHCMKGASATSLVELTLPVIRSFNVSILWLKDCKSGPSQHLELGYINTSGQRQKFVDGHVVVPATVALTEIYIRVSAPAISQEFGTANVSSSDTNVVTVSTRGSVSEGVAGARDPATIAVMYACHTNGKATISLNVPVPPWDDLEATLVKDCGGSAASISIGTSYGKDDVVSGGITSPNYFASVPDASDALRYSDVPIPASTKESSFLIKHTGGPDEDAVHFSNAVMTVGDSNSLRVSLRGFLSGADKFSQEEGMLYPGDARKLSVHFICLNTGSTWVVVSLPLMRYKSVEFGFTKECTGPKVYKESAIFNVGGVLKLLLVGVVLVIVGVYFFLRTGRGASGLTGPSETKYALVENQATGIGMR
jgi:hypothetical protein